jgi:hypothetical protein
MRDMYVPVAGDKAVDEDEHLELGQLVPRARVRAAPERQECVGPRRNLHERSNDQSKTHPSLIGVSQQCLCRP